MRCLQACYCHLMHRVVAYLTFVCVTIWDSICGAYPGAESHYDSASQICSSATFTAPQPAGTSEPAFGEQVLVADLSAVRQTSAPVGEDPVDVALNQESGRRHCHDGVLHQGMLHKVTQRLYAHKATLRLRWQFKTQYLLSNLPLRSCGLSQNCSYSPQ